VLVDDDVRQENAWSTYKQADQVARLLPLVHRTCKDGDESKWHEVLATRRFEAREPCTGDREKAAGIPRAAYFFLGCGAYPDGLVGFVLDAAAVLRRPASYTPFDSGSIEKYAVPADPMKEAAWDGAAKDRFLADHVGVGVQVAAFAGTYLAAHFRDPLTYVRMGQRGRPEFDAYHGLQSTSGDRRAWTIEVQAHEDVPFPEGSDIVTEIVAARQTLVEELPDDLVAIARVARATDEVLESLAEGIATRIAARAA